MNQGEQMRLKVLNSVLEHAMDVKEAAHVLGLSERHTWRILAAYRREGAASLVHGNRGREPANAINDSIKKQVLTLASTTYQGFNHTHLTEVLAEQEGLTLSRCTVHPGTRRAQEPAASSAATPSNETGADARRGKALADGRKFSRLVGG